jgi:hypothetical protein
MSFEVARELSNQALAGYEGDDRSVLEFCGAVTIKDIAERQTIMPGDLEKISKLYKQGSYIRIFPRFSRENEVAVSRDAAEWITDEPDLFPKALLQRAEDMFRSETSARIIPVSRVADQEGWFT